MDKILMASLLVLFTITSIPGAQALPVERLQLSATNNSIKFSLVYSLQGSPSLIITEVMPAGSTLESSPSYDYYNPTNGEYKWLVRQKSQNVAGVINYTIKTSGLASGRYAIKGYWRYIDSGGNGAEGLIPESTIETINGETAGSSKSGGGSENEETVLYNNNITEEGQQVAQADEAAAGSSGAGNSALPAGADSITGLAFYGAGTILAAVLAIAAIAAILIYRHKNGRVFAAKKSFWHVFHLSRIWCASMQIMGMSIEMPDRHTMRFSKHFT